MASPYLKAALLTLALTMLGFFFISQLDSMRANELRNEISALAAQSESERLLFLYSQVMDNSTVELCTYLSGAEQRQAGKAYELMRKIQYYEQSNVVNADYDRIREQYYLSNAGLYINMLAAKKNCGSSGYTTMLFFYRIKPDCPECRVQGGVLDNLRASRPELRVFAFPLDSNVPVVGALVARHNISQAPSLVIDDSIVLSGLQSEEQANAALAKK